MLQGAEMLTIRWSLMQLSYPYPRLIPQARYCAIPNYGSIKCVEYKKKDPAQQYIHTYWKTQPSSTVILIGGAI